MCDGINQALRSASRVQNTNTNCPHDIGLLSAKEQQRSNNGGFGPALRHVVAAYCDGKRLGGLFFNLTNDLRTHTSSHTMSHHTQHMREATHANTTTFSFFFFF